jgi:hypothetical protein
VARADELALLAALVKPVEIAMYWQEPDDEDRALADHVVCDALMPVAHAVASAPAARWWSGSAATGRQQYVEWLGPAGGPPSVTVQPQSWQRGELL